MTRHKPAVRDGLVPRRPPLFALDQLVVLRGFLDGWQWQVTDCRLGLPPKRGGKARSTKPKWLYTARATRPHDGRVVESHFWEYSLLSLDEATERIARGWVRTPRA